MNATNPTRIPWGYEGLYFEAEILDRWETEDGELCATVRLLDRGTVPAGEDFAEVGEVFNVFADDL